MQRPIIASVDGSDKDARAVAVATAIANLADADLRVIRVIDVPSERLVAQAKTIGLDDAGVSGRKAAERQLADLVAGVSVRGGRHVTVDVIEASDVAASIMDYAVQRDAQVLVMATRAPGGALGRAMAGSVADRVVRESPRPIVVVPPGAAVMGGKTYKSPGCSCHRMVRRSPSGVSSFSSRCHTPRSWTISSLRCFPPKAIAR